eukprot:58671-Pleurochrysis_carterae.AAC.3
MAYGQVCALAAGQAMSIRMSACIVVQTLSPEHAKSSAGNTDHACAKNIAQRRVNTKAVFETRAHARPRDVRAPARTAIRTKRGAQAARSGLVRYKGASSRSCAGLFIVSGSPVIFANLRFCNLTG